MSQEKYFFNPNTLQYEKHKTSGKERFYKSLGFLAGVLFTSLLIYTLANLFFPTPKEKSLERDLVQLKYYYQDLVREIDGVTANVESLQKKDAEVHRVVFGIDPIDESVWNGGTGGSENIMRIPNQEDLNVLLNNSLSKIELLKRKASLQKISLDSLLYIAKEHENKLASVPSIKPIREDKLKRNVVLLSGYGMRIHPIHKIRKMHYGIDFTAPQNTPIQATGNGKIVKIESKRSGYGKSILIDHGYGYTTLYGHLHSVTVKVGQRVLKGEQIGTVGSSGASTAPHCHYEIRVNDVPVNPLDYCMDGLSPLEYQEMVKRAKEENQSFDKD